MKLVGLLLSCALGAFAAGETIYIHGADVYPVSAPMMKNVSVLIENGKIVDVGPKVVAPKGVRTIEGKGLRVYPGLIDSNTELGLSEISAERVTVDTGEIGEFMPQLRAVVAVNPDSEHFGVVRVNGITSAMTFPNAGGGGGGRGGGSNQMISGQAALIHTDGWTWEEMEVRRSAAMSVTFPSLGGRGGRGGGGGNPDFAVPEIFGQTSVGGFTQQKRNYEQQIAKLSEFFDDSRKYQKARAANTPGFVRDLKYEAMLPVLEGKLPLAVTARNATPIRDAVAFAEKQNVKIVILQPREIGKVAPLLKEKKVPVILGRVLALPDEEDDPYDEAFTLPAEAYKAGLKFAFGTFTNEFVRNMPYQAAVSVAFGLPYDEALKAVTLNAAEIWGVADKIGSIDKGKIADLMITDGDPFDVRTQIRNLFINGKEITLSNKQIRLYEKYMSRQ